MSFLADKKREHESAAETALSEKNYAKAFFHTAKAAEFGFKLAEQSEGKVMESYISDAYELIELAEQMKAKAATQDSSAVKRVVKENAAGADDDEENKSSWMMKEKPSIKLDDVAGLSDVKETLREKV